jgi:uncharacterized protein (DUF952 family)
MHIYHITTRKDWLEAQRAGAYRADSLHSQGFIHCSTRAQILPVAGRYYPGRTDLMILSIEEEKVQSPVRYENLEGGAELFPHIYGELNLDAVAKAADFSPNDDGTFEFPAEME